MKMNVGIHWGFFLFGRRWRHQLHIFQIHERSLQDSTTAQSVRVLLKWTSRYRFYHTFSSALAAALLYDMQDCVTTWSLSPGMSSANLKRGVSASPLPLTHARTHPGTHARIRSINYNLQRSMDLANACFHCPPVKTSRLFPLLLVVQSRSLDCESLQL